MIVVREMMRVDKASGFGLARSARMERRDIKPEMEKGTDRRYEQESLERYNILKRPGYYKRPESGVRRRWMSIGLMPICHLSHTVTNH